MIPPVISVPFLGEVRTADFSLPALTIVPGAIDGFNPCAMWVLVFLIGLLLGMEDRLRMWVLGTAFIAGSALVYFLFMAARCCSRSARFCCSARSGWCSAERRRALSLP